MFLQTLVALKRTGCGVWQLECQASSVAVSVLSDHLLHECILPVFSMLINRVVHQAVLKFSLCRNKPLRKPQHVHISTRAPPVECPR